MATETVASEATRIQLLADLLTLEEVEEAVLEKLKHYGCMYKVSGLHPNAPSTERQRLSAQFIKINYDIARILQEDRALYDHLNDSLFAYEEEGGRDPTPVEIFESVLTYSLDSKSRRWRDYASKIARILELMSKQSLSSDDVVNRLEAVGGIEKLR